MNVFGTVKTSINTREAAVRYGVEVNRHGKALCPFHNDRHPSLFVDDDHYYCYACGEYGDVIDFTSKLHGLSLYDTTTLMQSDTQRGFLRKLPIIIRRELRVLKPLPVLSSWQGLDAAKQKLRNTLNRNLYYTLHEADITKFVDTAQWKI